MTTYKPEEDDAKFAKYSIGKFRAAMFFWVLISVTGAAISIIGIDNFIVLGVGFGIFILGVLGWYSTMWMFKKGRRYTGDLSDLK